MFEIFAIIIAIVIAINLNSRMSRLEKTIKEQLKKNSFSMEKNPDFTKPADVKNDFISQPVNSQKIYDKKEKYSEIQQNIQKNVDVKKEDIEIKQYEEDPITKFFSWLVKDWPMKIGAFLVISAIGWFVSYAFRNDWISPEGRVFIGLLFGIVLLVIGAFRSFKQKIQGNVLMVIGGISVLVAIISGVVMYELFPVELVFIVSLLVVAFLSAMAMKQNNLSLGVVTYLLGAIIPFFVISDIEINTLFFYLFVLTSGTLWIVYKTKWRALTVISLLVVAMYSLVFSAIEGFERNTVNLIFSFMFSAVFYFANISALISSKKVTFADMFVSLGTGLLFLMWMNMVADKDLISIFVLLGAFIFAVGSFVLYKLSSLKHPVAMYSVVSLTLLAAATAVELEGFALTIALITEFTLAIIIWLFLASNERLPKINFSSVLIFGIPLLMSLENIADLFEYISDYGYYGDNFNVAENLFVVFYICLAAFLVGISMLYFSAIKNKSIDYNQRFVLRTFLAIGGIYATALIWIVSHLSFMSLDINSEFAIMTSLIIYTLAGVYFYVTGKKNSNTALRVAGDLFFVIVILRVFLVEFWQMDIVERIITLFVVGVLLVSTVFFGRKDKK